VTFSEPVCRIVAFAATDWTVSNIATTTPATVGGDSIPTCNAAKDNAAATAILTISPAMPNGAFVETTLNSIPAVGGTTNTSIVDTAANAANAPQSRQASATAPTTSAPTLVSASGAVGATTMTLTFSQPIYCTGFVPAGNITLNDNNTATVDPTVTGYGTVPCPTTALTASTTFNVTLSAGLPAATTYVVTMTPAAGTITNQYGQSLPNPSTTTFTTGQQDFTPPTMVDARMTAKGTTSSDFGVPGDAFSVTFSEKMNGATTGTIAIQDQDGTSATIQCGAGGTAANQAVCTWNTAVTTLTVSFTGASLTLTAPGSTFGMQIPFNITGLTGVTDVAGNPVNVLGSSDRLVNY
jgi:hypothetical protein